MTIKFEVAEGELAACTIMEQAAAIWKYYKSTDDVQELVNYLQIAIDAERNRDEGEPHNKRVGYAHYFRR